MAGGGVLGARQSHRLQPLMIVRLDPGADGSTERGLAVDGDRAQQPAPSPRQLPPLPVTRLDEPGASATLDAAKPLSLRFAEPMPIRDVLLLLVRDTGLSLVTAPDVEGQFVGELRNVSLRRALDLVLRPLALDYEVEGTAIRVFRRQVATRFFDISIPGPVRSAEAAVTASSSLSDAAGGNGSRSAVRWEHAPRSLADLGSGIQSLLSSEGRFALDAKAGVVQVTDYPERLERVAIYLESVERRLHRQVQIQARVVEVTLADPAATGVDWDAAVESARPPGSGASRSIDFDAFLRALGAQGSVTVLASPRLQVMHNEPALMRVGIQDVTFLPAASNGDDESAAALGTTLDGFTLAVTPQIDADGMVTMNVAPSLTVPTGDTRARDGQRVLVVAVEELNTAVRLRDGETLVLPGLRRPRDTRVAADTKGLIGLFRRERTQQTRSELAVLLTPTIRR